MSIPAAFTSSSSNAEVWGRYRLLDLEVLANPYSLHYQSLAAYPVHGVPFPHTGKVARHLDMVRVQFHLSARRTPTPEQLTAHRVTLLTQLTEMLGRQVLFLVPHTLRRSRQFVSKAFIPRRVEKIRSHIQNGTDRLLDARQYQGHFAVIADPLLARVTLVLLGLRSSDYWEWTRYTTGFYNLFHASQEVRSMEGRYAYFCNIIRAHRQLPREEVMRTLLSEEDALNCLTEEEGVGTSITLVTGAQETNESKIGIGLLTLLRLSDQLEKQLEDHSLMLSVLVEMLPYEHPVQYTLRSALYDRQLGETSRKRQGTLAVMAVVRRDSERISGPYWFCIYRRDKRHLALSWEWQFCCGAPLVRHEGHWVFETVVRRGPDLRPVALLRTLAGKPEPSGPHLFTSFV